MGWLRGLMMGHGYGGLCWHWHWMDGIDLFAAAAAAVEECFHLGSEDYLCVGEY